MPESQRQSDNLLIIIARAPIAGATKTRLGSVIGMDRAAHLHRAFLTDLAARFAPLRSSADRPYDFAWSWGPANFDFPGLIGELDPLSAQRGAMFLPQIEDNFAARLTDLFVRARDLGYQHVQIMASDSPHLPLDWTLDGFNLLARNDVILGRVEDGGYYVIGMSGVHDVLSPAVMSTSSAASNLISGARRKGLRVGEVPASFDVDTAQDLRLLIAALQPDGAFSPATWQALHDTWLINPLSLHLTSQTSSTEGPPLP